MSRMKVLFWSKTRRIETKSITMDCGPSECLERVLQNEAPGIVEIYDAKGPRKDPKTGLPVNNWLVWTLKNGEIIWDNDLYFETLLEEEAQMQQELYTELSR